MLLIEIIKGNKVAAKDFSCGIDHNYTIKIGLQSE